jgi:hypothetical protein
MRSRVSGPAGFAIAAALVVLLVVAAGRMAPWLTEQRQITSSVPVPPPLFTISPVRIEPGRQACTDQVALDRRSGVAAIRIAPPASGIPRLDFTARAGTWRARSVFRGGLGPHGDMLEASFSAPPGPRVATVCVRNAGARTAALVGTEEPRTATDSTTTIDRVTQPDLSMTIYEPGTKSLLAGAPQVLDRAALYKAGFLRGWMLVPLVLLVVVGVPLGVLWALGRALRDDAVDVA